MRGRKGQPAEVKAAKGNPGKRPLDVASDTAAPEMKNTTPPGLTVQGKKIWQDIAPKLSHSKLLRDTDRHLLMRYCDTLAQYWKVTRKVRKKGEAYNCKMTHGGKMLRINPWFSAQERLGNRLEKMEDRLGLSPRARQELMFRLAQVPAAPPGELFVDNSLDPDTSDISGVMALSFLNAPPAGNA